MRISCSGAIWATSRSRKLRPRIRTWIRWKRKERSEPRVLSGYRKPTLRRTSRSTGNPMSMCPLWRSCSAARRWSSSASAAGVGKSVPELDLEGPPRLRPTSRGELESHGIEPRRPIEGQGLRSAVRSGSRVFRRAFELSRLFQMLRESLGVGVAARLERQREASVMRLSSFRIQTGSDGLPDAIVIRLDFLPHLSLAGAHQVTDPKDFERALSRFEVRGLFCDGELHRPARDGQD